MFFIACAQKCIFSVILLCVLEKNIFLCTAFLQKTSYYSFKK